jgi:hypothetical protein
MLIRETAELKANIDDSTPVHLISLHFVRKVFGQIFILPELGQNLSENFRQKVI